MVEAAAFAVEYRDYGQRVEAGVKLVENSVASMDELLAICHEKLGAFKSPNRIHVLAELPKGPLGKIQRIKLAKLVCE